MNIYYQSELYGKEITDSIARYLKNCLTVDKIKKIEIKCEKDRNIIDELTDKHLFIFSNIDCDFTYWITLVNNILKDINGKDVYLNIIDITCKKNFPITIESDEIISISKYGVKEWLSKLTIELLNNKTDIKLKDDYIKDCRKVVVHKVRGHYNSIEDFIDYFMWHSLKNDLLKIWNGESDNEKN